MNRFIYWLKARYGKEEVQCKHFCVTCKYFERCEEDLSVLYAGKSEKITEVKANNSSDLKKAS